MSPLTELHLAIADEDMCPRCLGEIDDYWVCVACGFDVFPLIEADFPELTEPERDALKTLPFIEELMAKVSDEKKGQK